MGWPLHDGHLNDNNDDDNATVSGVWRWNSLKKQHQAFGSELWHLEVVSCTTKSNQQVLPLTLMDWHYHTKLGSWLMTERNPLRTLPLRLGTFSLLTGLGLRITPCFDSLSSFASSQFPAVCGGCHSRRTAGRCLDLARKLCPNSVVFSSIPALASPSLRSPDGTSSQSPAGCNLSDADSDVLLPLPPLTSASQMLSKSQFPANVKIEEISVKERKDLQYRQIVCRNLEFSMAYMPVLILVNIPLITMC